MPHVYIDTCIIGTEISALATAALLAQAGKRVMVIDVHDAKETESIGGFDAPVIPILWQVPQHGPVLQVFEQLELKADIRRLLGARTRFAFINDPQERLLLHPQPSQLKRELIRAFGNKAEELIDYLEHLPLSSLDNLLTEACYLYEKGIWASFHQKKRHRQLGGLSSLANNNQLLAALQNTCLLPYLEAMRPFSQYDLSASPQHTNAYLWARNLWGVHWPLLKNANHVQLLKALLVSSIKRHGGQIITEETILSIETRKKYIHTINTAHNYKINVNTVIDGTSSRHLSRFFQDHALKQELTTYYETLSPYNDGSVVRWLIPRSSLPSPLPPISVVLDQNAPEEPPSLLGIFEVSAQTRISSPQSHSSKDLMLVSMFISHHPAGQEEANRLATKRLYHILPFAASTAVATDALYSDRIRLLAPQFTLKAGICNPLGGLPIHTPIKNLYRAGKDNVPSLGLDGQISLAHALVKTIQEQLGKEKNPFYNMFSKVFQGKSSEKAAE